LLSPALSRARHLLNWLFLGLTPQKALCLRTLRLLSEIDQVLEVFVGHTSPLTT
jgi:hypothetical protein